MSGQPGARSHGRDYWSGLEELSQSAEFRARAAEAFPQLEAAAAHAPDRRRFLQLMAASMSLMGLASCGPEEQPRDRVPYVEQPQGIVPGRARYFATATSLGGYGSGVLIEHQMGRPIKVEGNPDHPASLGATSAIGQASILNLYDPFRAQAITQAGEITTCQALVTAVADRRQATLANHGDRFAILTGTVTSPTLAAQLGALKQQFPELRWHQWEPMNRDQVRRGAELAFGQHVETIPDFAAADVIVAVGSDFLEWAPGHLKFARDFAARRRANEVHERMSRLYALESTPTLAGAKADHRVALPPAQIERALRRLAGTVGAGPEEWSALDHPQAAVLDAMAQDLQAAHGNALLHAGAPEPAVVHALVHAINRSIGAFGKTLRAFAPVAAEPVDQTRSFGALVEAMHGGLIDVLLILADNPVFTAPADYDFEAALQKVPVAIYLGEYADETAAAVEWHVPRTHEYESWGDVRAFDGTATIQQPQLQLYPQRRSPHELLAMFSGDTSPDARAIVTDYWRSATQHQSVSDFDTWWHETLRAGTVPGTAQQPVSFPPVNPDLAAKIDTLPAANQAGPTLLFRPDDALYDGRFADNGWLQELGRPLTRLTWDNAALLAPQTAKHLGVGTGDIVEITSNTQRVRAPVWVFPGQAEECVTLPLGFGRRRTGPVGEGVGFDAYPLRAADAQWQAAGGTLRKLEGKHAFAPIQHEFTTHGRDVVREGTLAAFLQNPQFVQRPSSDESLYPGYDYTGIAWAMSINLDSCIGCQACVVACQAENNSPVVGKAEVSRGREMHWLRIDRYYSGPLEEPQFVFQPVPCMHCENAPCEVVCPVHATVHDSEGLNVMVYNRCVGTRFCSNNCPYKVRRFNFFDYSGFEKRPRASWNPEVTVRGRGVMEKCTYCVQRTRAAMIDADRENRSIRDGEVVTACQQACPTRAITFGDKNDKSSAVAVRKSSPLDYRMFDELNTRPRTSYEALIRNPKPGLGNA